MYVLHKLTVAAANSAMRQDMNVEDEYYKAIEDRDTANMQRDKILKEQSEQLSQKDEQLSQKDEQLSQKDEQLSQKDKQLSQKDKQLSQKDKQLRNMAKALFANGMTKEQISTMTGIDIANVVKLLK